VPALPAPAGRRLAADAALAAALAALPFALFRGALGLWWTEDDFFQLRYALGHGPLEYGLDPEVWRLLPNRVLSPLLFASYDLDLALFGPDLSSATAFYAHQLASVGLAAAALFLVLRLWLPQGWAAAGGLTFLLGAPTASLASHLMVRHYPESTVLALAAAGTWVLAVRRRSGSGALSALSALLYLGACAAKEIAVPLPFLLALLPEGDRRRRLRLLIPHGVALALYAGYRAWMLGTPLGGYGFATTPADWPRLALALPWKAARELAAGGGWGWAMLAVALLPLLWLVLRGRRAALLLAVGAALALGPVLPVSVEMVPRYAVAAWLVVAVALPFGLREALLTDRTWVARAAIALAVLGALLGLHRAAWAGHLERAGRMSAEARGFLDLGPADLLRRPLLPPAAMGELRRFAREVLGARTEADWFYDDLYLCDAETGRPSPPAARVHQYDPDTGRLEEITGRVAALAREHCGSIRRQAPLEAELRPGAGGVLAWELGPYEEGDYAFVLEDGRLRYDMPRSGAFHLGGLRRLALRVHYESPAGWVTYSDEIELELAGPGFDRAGPGRPHRWRR
jgi:hypothetical protein